MRIFTSWSGEESRKVAELIRDWLPLVIQEAEVWVSSQDIEKGQRWLSSVGNNLASIDYGIIVVTPDNRKAPWLMFEAGALSKSLESRVTAFLCDLNHNDVAGTPLFQFQNTLLNQQDVFQSVRMINDLSAKPISDQRLAKSFAVFWPEFERNYKSIVFTKKDNEEQASDQGRDKVDLLFSEVFKTINRLQSGQDAIMDALTGTKAHAVDDKTPRRSETQISASPAKVENLESLEEEMAKLLGRPAPSRTISDNQRAKKKEGQGSKPEN